MTIEILDDDNFDEDLECRGLDNEWSEEDDWRAEDNARRYQDYKSDERGMK